MIDILNEKSDFNGGVIIVKPRPSGNYELLEKQDGLFHVALSGNINPDLSDNIRLVKCINKIINPYRLWFEFLATAENPDIRFIISNTTESGIVFDAEEIIKRHECPINFPAKLTRWLHHRFHFFEGNPNKGCIILPTELIVDNGSTLKKCVLQYIEHLELGESFKNWILDYNYFCSTLVDRIISGFPEEQKDEIIQHIGYDDKLIVRGEAYWLSGLDCGGIFDGGRG